MSLGRTVDTDTASGHEVVRIVADEFKNLVAVVGQVVVDGPQQVGGADGLPVQGHLDTGVAQRTDVLVECVAEVGHCREGSPVQQVGSLAIVPVDATTQALVHDTPVQTDVGGRCGLPLQLGVVNVGPSLGAVAADIIERTHAAVAHHVGSKVVVVADAFLLTGLTPTETQFQVAEGTIFHEVFLVDLPCQGCRGEQCPVLLEA